MMDYYTLEPEAKHRPFLLHSNRKAMNTALPHSGEGVAAGGGEGNWRAGFIG